MPHVRRKHRRRSIRNEADYQRLESRRVLAGNVAIVVQGGVLTVVGDAQANQVQVSQQASGALVVTGLDDTTVNGSSTAFVSAGGRLAPESLTLVMNGGNDSAIVDGVVVWKGLSFHGGQGNDHLNVTASNSLIFHGAGGDGDDVFELDMSSRRSAYLYLGAGNDTVAITNVSSGRNFKIFGGDGNDDVITAQLHSHRKLEIDLANGDDRLVVTGQTSVNRRANIDLGEGADFLALQTATTGGQFDLRRQAGVDLGNGNDAAILASSFQLARQMIVDGGPGIDALNQSATDSRLAPRNFENIGEDLASRLDQVFADLEQRGIDLTPFGQGEDADDEEPVVDPELNIADGPLTFTEGDNPLNLDASLSLTGDSAASVTQVVIGIDGFQSGADELTLANPPAGVEVLFDDVNGQLILTPDPGIAGSDDVALFQTALRGVQFVNTSDAPTSTARSLNVLVEIDGQILSDARTVNVIPVNDAPVIQLSDTEIEGPFGREPLLLDPNLALTDPDTAQFSLLTVSIIDGFAEGEDELTFQNQGNVVGSFNGATGVLTLAGTEDVAVYQEVLRSVAIVTNGDEAPADGTRVIRFDVSDGQLSATADLSVDLVT